MYVGQIVEVATTTAIFGHPRHPYTAALMQAVPVPDPRAPRGDAALAGEVANPDTCRTERPILREIGAGHLVRCHRAEELTLAGA